MISGRAVRDKPVIHYVVEEAIDAGIDDIIIITGRGKRAIEDYFDASPELEMRLKDQIKNDILKRLKKISDFPGIHYVRQKEPNGLGDAILKQKNISGMNPLPYSSVMTLLPTAIRGPVSSCRSFPGFTHQ